MACLGCPSGPPVTVAQYIAATARPGGSSGRLSFGFLKILPQLFATRRKPRLLLDLVFAKKRPSPINHTCMCAYPLVCCRSRFLSEIAEVYDPGPRPGDSVRSAAEALRARAASRRWTMLHFHGEGCPCCATAAGEVAAAPASAFARPLSLPELCLRACGPSSA